MKSNLNEIFERILPDLKGSNDVDVDEVLRNDILPEIKFAENPTKAELIYENTRGKLTSLLNNNRIYSYKKGHFVSIENANAEQLKYFKAKAERDIAAAEKRKVTAEELIHQISMAFDENGKFIGFITPEAVSI